MDAHRSDDDTHNQVERDEEPVQGTSVRGEEPVEHTSHSYGTGVESKT